MFCPRSQALSSLPGDLAELLRSPHVTSLRNEEVLLLKDSRKPADRRDSTTQVDMRGGSV